MNAHLFNVLIAVAENEEFVPPDDWRGVIALPIGILIFFGSIFLLLRSNLGTRRAYLVEASCFFGFMTILSLFWAFGAPGTPQYTGPQNLPGRTADYYLPKWVAFAGDSTLAEERFSIVKQFPEGFELEGGGGGEESDADAAAAGAAGDDAGADSEGAGVGEGSASAGADEVGNFFREQRSGAQLVADEWVLDGPPMVATADGGDKVVAATYVTPFALNEDGEIPTGPSGRELFTEDQIGQPVPEDFQVPPGSDESVTDLLTRESFTGFAFYDPAFPLLPSLVMIMLSLGGFIIHALLLGWDENRERERTVEEVVIEREPVGASAP